MASNAKKILDKIKTVETSTQDNKDYITVLEEVNHLLANKSRSRSQDTQNFYNQLSRQTLRTV